MTLFFHLNPLLVPKKKIDNLRSCWVIPCPYRELLLTETNLGEIWTTVWIWKPRPFLLNFSEAFHPPGVWKIKCTDLRQCSLLLVWLPRFLKFFKKRIFFHILHPNHSFSSLCSSQSLPFPPDPRLLCYPSKMNMPSRVMDQTWHNKRHMLAYQGWTRQSGHRKGALWGLRNAGPFLTIVWQSECLRD